MTPYPVLISIPHGGTQIPPEVTEAFALSARDVLQDSDAFTREIYDLGPHVQQVLKADIVRAVVDLNRAPDDRPPVNPDGVIKSHTCYQKPVYHDNQAISTALAEVLLKRYYTPYHHQIECAVQDDSLALVLDCHSMAAVGPPIAPDTGQQRPLICLGNRHGQTCSAGILDRLSDCFATAFEIRREAVAQNQPFAGGYLTRHYGTGPIPWVQVEMSRALYLSEPWFDWETLQMEPARIQLLNRQFKQAIALYFEKI